MKLKSLRLRLTLYASLIVLGAIVMTGIGLSYQFQRHIERRVGQELNAHLTQIIGDLRFDDNAAPSLARQLSDPRFGRIFGGLYYQVLSENGEVLLKSRSLWDTQLALPDDDLEAGDLHIHTHPGPNDSSLLVHERVVTFDKGAKPIRLRISVGIDKGEILALRNGFSEDIFLLLALLAAILLLGFAAQISAGMRPLDALRKNVAGIRSGNTLRLEGEVPSEVAPLVEEVNGLLDLQDQNMIRARDRAADMAHGLKTPLTALASDVTRLRKKGETELADDIEELGLRMQRHLDRELARARLRHSVASVRTDASPAIDAILRTLVRTPFGAPLRLTNNVPEGVSLAMEPDDFNDVLGNLLENACRYSASWVQVDIVQTEIQTFLKVTDDGPGLSAPQIENVARRGKRLDSSGHGAGLGLSIVGDILEAYGGELTFQNNAPKGLIAIAQLPNRLA
ncbi:MAG: HAMP domain-containing sensor histidine kinase [Planktotalea sp.]|uniref:ATP-binding protein n=1 Tax=Planktotalea sp. TaxID=2029877 RepID=UPI003C771C15